MGVDGAKSGDMKNRLFSCSLTAGIVVGLIGVEQASTSYGVATAAEQRVEVLAYGCPFTGARTVAISMHMRFGRDAGDTG